MCLLIFAHQVSPQYPLLVAANRDEFHGRGTAASQFWTDHPDLLAGKDLVQGGTWMGVTRSGRFAAITNYRVPAQSPPAPRSRGELPLQYLTGEQGPQAFLLDIGARAQEYAGFNLLVGDRAGLWYFSNSIASENNLPRCLPPGVYGLSNARLDTPWPKVESGKARLKQLLSTGSVSHDELSTAVSRRTLEDIENLELRGLNAEMERILSAQFIVTQDYGTRSSTTLWATRDGTASWREQTFDEQGVQSGVRLEEIEMTAV